MNFHLICDNCRRSKSNLIVNAEMRRIYIGAKNSSPNKFIERFGATPELIKNLSEILKRIINQILNRRNNRSEDFWCPLLHKMKKISLSISIYLLRVILPYFAFSWILLSVILFVQQASRFSDIFFNTDPSFKSGLAVNIRA